jgi:type II secretory pathway pseudopilin PulG
MAVGSAASPCPPAVTARFRCNDQFGVGRSAFGVRRLLLFEMIRARQNRPAAFTLVELLVVITIIIVLMGLLFPAFTGVQNQAKKTQAKNDLVQIVTAVNAFYTEYGKYPVAATVTDDVSATYGTTTSAKSVLDALRALDLAMNPRQIAFITPPDAKDQTSPAGGMKSLDGQFYDPWGSPYVIRIDANYDNFVTNPYSSGAGVSKDTSGAFAVQAGVITWSLGKDKAGGTGDKGTGTGKDDVISWQ